MIKRQVYAFIFILVLKSNAYCQQDFGVWGERRSWDRYSFLYSEFYKDMCALKTASSITITDKKLLIIGDTICNDKNRWCLSVFKGKKHIIEPSEFTNRENIEKELTRIKIANPDLLRREQLAIQFLDGIAEEEEKKMKTELDSLEKELGKILLLYRKNNLVLWEWSFGHTNDYSKFTDVDITIINPYKTKIKYLWFTFLAFNPVGDQVRDGMSGKTEITVRGIGPIEYKDKGVYSFENVFYSNVIETMRIKQIKIQFFDGTFKTILNPKEIQKD